MNKKGGAQLAENEKAVTDPSQKPSWDPEPKGTIWGWNEQFKRWVPRTLRKDATEFNLTTFEIYHETHCTV